MVLADSNYKSGNPTSLGTLYSSNAFQAAPFGGRLSVSDDWYEGVEGKEMSALVPILNNDGAVIAALCLDWRVDDFGRRIDEQKQVSLLIFSIAIVVALLLSFLLTSWVSIPLSKLRLGAEQLSKRDFKHEVSINSQDEFGLLAATFNKVSSELDEFTRNMDGIVEAKTVQLTKAKEELVAVNSILNQENVHLGAEVSNLIALRERALPYLDTAEQRAALKDYQIELHYLPSQALCGDLWQAQVDERGANITLGQVSGYGLETAMMAMQVQSLLKEVSASGSDPLASINHYLYDQNESINLNLLCKVMSVQIENNTLSVVGSGESPIKFGNEPSRLIDVPTMLPLGVKSSVDVDPVCLSLEQGEGIFLFSTGFKLALAKLHDIDADTLEPSNIIKLSEILDNNGVTLLEKIKSQDWFDDFQQDISFILIRYQGSV
jgi:HAMP domain-containing protein